MPATEITPMGPSNFFKKSLVSSLISNSKQKDLIGELKLTIFFLVIDYKWIGFRREFSNLLR